MTDALVSMQQAALQQLQLSSLLQSDSANSALQQLQRQCYATAPYQAYSQRPDLIASLQQLPQQLGCSSNELARVLILKLIAEFSIARLPLALPDKISHNYQHSMQRILQLWSSEPAAALQQINDRILKDVGLLVGALLPFTERVVEPYSAIQRSLLYNHSFAQGWHFVRALLQARGNKPVCRLHIHLSEINSLTAVGWRQTCLELAQLLLLNKQLKGVVGASWFYDPTIAAISPKLAFISELLTEMQASCFFSNLERQQSGALRRSSSRQHAFKTGQYQPKCYVIFITRRQLLNWYHRQVIC